MRRGDKTMRYRPEIDGLRAVAILPVVLFHAQIPGFSGGFAGIDVFFVVSGFLITSLILDDLEHGRFRLLSFYERRARRLLPALYLMLAVCIPFAWAWMLPDDLENFGQSLVATILFSNNLLLYMTTGYWDLEAEFKPLLHTWTLGIEEQYYVLFPLLLAAVWRPARALVLAGLIVLFGLSLARFLPPPSALLSTTGESRDFLLLPVRAWELAVGAIGAVAVRRDIVGRDAAGRLPGRALAIAGGILVVAALLLPGGAGGLPFIPRVLAAASGTLLLLIFLPAVAPLQAALSLRPVVAIGLISYGIYLWHQPLLAFLRIYVDDAPGWLVLLPVLLSFAVAALSYRFVERPFRTAGRISSPLAVTLFVAGAAILGGAGYLFHASGGLPGRLGLSESGQSARDGREFNLDAYRFAVTAFPANGRPNVLVLGDSFGRDFVNVLRAMLPEGTANIAYGPGGGNCIASSHNPVLRDLYQGADVVLLARRHLPSAECVDGDIDRATSDGKRIFYVGTKHFGYNMNWIVRLPADRRANLTNPLLAETIAQEQAMATLIPPANYLSILDRLASDGRVPITDAAGRILSLDRYHLTRAGAVRVAAALADSPLREAILQPGTAE